MIEITREDLIFWLQNPITKGFYQIFKAERLRAEDDAFNSALDNFKSQNFEKRSTNEIFNFAKLEVANYFLSETFHPLYENLNELHKEKVDHEMPREDFIDNFINKLKENLKNG